jgi:membrane associated rhomboid family serine protease
MENEKPRILTSLLVPVILLTLMWGLRFLSWFRVYPSRPGHISQTLKGLPGILFSPLVHADFSHLSANSVSAFVLTAMLFYFYREIALQVFLLLWLLTGLWVWAGAREAYHIGASGLVYGLAAFLFLSGLIRRDTRLAAWHFLWCSPMAAWFGASFRSSSLRKTSRGSRI